MDFEKQDKTKRICNILFGLSDSPEIAYKDCGMFLYTLSKNFSWKSTYVYYKTRESDTIWNQEFSSYVNTICIGETSDYKKQIELAKIFLKEHIHEFDVIMFFNYGSTVWKLAKYCKQLKPDIIVYSKLDMGVGGFEHFCGNKSFMWLRNYTEKFKSRYVDLFTVETKSYHDALSKTSIFRNRLGYLPNGVSTLDVYVSAIDSIQKENIVITVGRLGEYVKNNELLLDAIKLLPDHIVKKWKFMFIGPSTEAFIQIVKNFKERYSEKADSIIMTGNITDRTQLYTYCRRAKIICMTSRTESTCLATLEGMYFGAYPIITNYSDFALDTTNRGNCGRIVENGNSDKLSAELYNAMVDNDLLSKCIISQNYARKMFDYNELSKKLVEMLENMN